MARREGRGGARDGGTAAGGLDASLSREELYELAQERGLEGRSRMSKEQLADALRRDEQEPDALTLLRRQHDELRRLFAAFGDLPGGPSSRKDDLVREMITLLVKHAEIEEQVFYPAVRAAIDGAVDEVDESLEEHHAAELLLAELDRMSSDADRYDAKVTVLIENVTHHLEEEESELFPQVERALSEQRRREIGAAMQQVWRVAPTRPHPRTPDTPPGNVVTGLPATVIDLTVGAARGALRLVTRGR